LVQGYESLKNQISWETLCMREEDIPSAAELIQIMMKISEEIKNK
jgi:hypothetical protein